MRRGRGEEEGEEGRRRGKRGGGGGWGRRRGKRGGGVGREEEWEERRSRDTGEI